MSQPGPIEDLINAAPTDGLFTRRQYITRKLLLMGGGTFWLVSEGVALSEATHPEWDWDEEKSWDEWEAILVRGIEARDE